MLFPTFISNPCSAPAALVFFPSRTLFLFLSFHSFQELPGPSPPSKVAAVRRLSPPRCSRPKAIVPHKHFPQGPQWPLLVFSGKEGEGGTRDGPVRPQLTGHGGVPAGNGTSALSSHLQGHLGRASISFSSTPEPSGSSAFAATTKPALGTQSNGLSKSVDSKA